MATHFVSSSSDTFEYIKLTKNSFINSQVLEVLKPNVEVTVLEEYLGNVCEYHYVSSSAQAGYVLSKYIFPLENTPNSSPYVCYNTSPIPSYIPPEWHLLTENEPYIDSSTQEYCVCIANNSFSFNDVDEKEIVRRGVDALCRYYNKPRDEASLDKYMEYYIFAKIKDFYVPYRPLIRTKYLVSVSRKYFDAIEDAVEVQPVLSSCKTDTLIEIDLKEIEQKFKSLASILGLYNTDVVLTNSTLVYSTSEVYGGLQNDFVNEINFSEKKKNVENFKKRLDNLLSLNEIDPNPPVTMLDEVYIQFAINGECNKLCDIAVKINGICKKLRKGIDAFLKSEPVMDETTVNFVKYIHNINQIDKCKVPWYDFAERYVYPSVVVLAPVVENDIPSYELFKNLYNQFLSFQAKTKEATAKTYEQIYQEQVEILGFQTTQYFTVGPSPFLRLLFQADNNLDPTNLQAMFDRLNLVVSESPLSTKNNYAIKQNGEYISVSGEGETWTIGSPSTVDITTYKIDTENPSVTIDGLSYTLYKSSKADQANKRINDGRDFVRKQLDQIYKVINEIGICKLTDIAFGCLLSLARSIQLDVDKTLTLSVIKNYKYNKIINEIIPYLPAEQQQFLYEQLLLDLGCVNRDSLLYTLKNYLSSSEYTTLNLDNASYEDVVREVSKRMVIQVVSE